MVTYSNYRYSSPEAWHLADLGGIENDLLAVIFYCERMQRDIDAAKYDYVLWEALGIAAVIRYARCFSKGVRVSLGKEVFQDAELLAKHEHFIDVRNKHVAHSVNPFEDNAVTVQIADHYVSSDEIQYVGVGQVYVSSMGRGDFAVLKKLSGYVLDVVRGEMENEKERLLKLVRRTPMEKLKKHGPLRLGMDEVANKVGVRRKRVG
jgi:hypothetical protein